MIYCTWNNIKIEWHKKTSHRETYANISIFQTSHPLTVTQHPHTTSSTSYPAYSSIHTSDSQNSMPSLSQYPPTYPPIPSPSHTTTPHPPCHHHCALCRLPDPLQTLEGERPGVRQGVVPPTGCEPALKWSDEHTGGWCGANPSCSSAHSQPRVHHSHHCVDICVSMLFMVAYWSYNTVSQP